MTQKYIYHFNPDDNSFFLKKYCLSDSNRKSIKDKVSTLFNIPVSLTSFILAAEFKFHRKSLVKLLN